MVVNCLAYSLDFLVYGLLGFWALCDFGYAYSYLYHSFNMGNRSESVSD